LEGEKREKRKEKMESEFVQFIKTLPPKKTFTKSDLLELWREYQGVNVVIEGIDDSDPENTEVSTEHFNETCNHFYKGKDCHCHNPCVIGSKYCETHLKIQTKKNENYLILKRHPTLKMYWNPYTHLVFNGVDINNQIVIGKTTKIDPNKKSVILPLEESDIEKCREIGYRYDDTVIPKKEKIARKKGDSNIKTIPDKICIKAQDIKLLSEM
jgi:hypothetical protein